MARARNIKVEGLDELTQQFQKLMATAEGPALQDAILQGARMLEDEVERRAPVAPYPTHRFGAIRNPGDLKKSVKSAKGRKYKFFLQAYTFTLKDLAPHAFMVEFGTKARTIQGKKMRIRGAAGHGRPYPHDPATVHRGSEARDAREVRRPEDGQGSLL